MDERLFIFRRYQIQDADRAESLAIGPKERDAVIGPKSMVGPYWAVFPIRVICRIWDIERLLFYNYLFAKRVGLKWKGRADWKGITFLVAGYHRTDTGFRNLTDQ